VEWSKSVLRQSPADKNVCTDAEDIVVIRHQATTGEDIADLVPAVVKCRVCELAIAVQLSVLMTCMCLIHVRSYV
jgi:hypothetical protein